MNLYLSCALSSLLIRFVFPQFAEIASSSHAVWALRKRSGATAQFLCARKAEAGFASRRGVFRSFRETLVRIGWTESKTTSVV